MWSKFIFWLVVIFLLKLLVIGNLGLSDDEAYYWEFSRHLDFGYFDHPPAVAWAIRLSTELGKVNEFFVRLPAALFSSLSMLFLYLFCRSILKSHKAAILLSTTINLVPFFLLGSILILPDVFFIFFGILSVCFFYKACFQKNNIYFLATGFFGGLGLLSKYHAIFLPFSSFLFLFFSSKHRELLKNKNLYLAALIAGLLFLPVIIWNYQNDWASFKYQFLSRHEQTGFSLQNSGLFSLSQFGLVSPLLYILIVFVLIQITRTTLREKSSDTLFLLCFALPMLIFFHIISPFTSFKPHWGAFGYIFSLILVFYAALKNKKIKKYLVISLTISFILSGFIILEAFYPVFNLPERINLTNDLYGWKQVGKTISELVEKMPQPSKTFIFSNRYQIASRLSFYTPGQPRVVSLNRKLEQYNFWQDEQGLINRDAIFVTNSRYFVDPEKLYNFQKIILDSQIQVKRKDRIAQTFYFYRCYGYKGLK